LAGQTPSDGWEDPGTAQERDAAMRAQSLSKSKRGESTTNKLAVLCDGIRTEDEDEDEDERSAVAQRKVYMYGSVSAKTGGVVGGGRSGGLGFWDDTSSQDTLDNGGIVRKREKESERAKKKRDR